MLKGWHKSVAVSLLAVPFIPTALAQVTQPKPPKPAKITIRKLESSSAEPVGFIEPEHTLDLHLADDKPKGYTPPSLEVCPINAPVDASPMAADHTIPSNLLPPGAPVILGPDNLSQGQIRIVVFDGSKVVKTLDLQRKYTPPVAPPHTWTINITAVGGIPTRQPQDGFDFVGSYTPGFRYRLELCVKGKFEPVISPEKSHASIWNTKYHDDEYSVIFGNPQTDPTPSNVQTSVNFSFPPRSLEVHVDIKTKCTGIPSVAAASSNSVQASVIDHFTREPIAVANLGAVISYNGAVHQNPENGLFPGASGYVDPFPYGSPISRSADNTNSITVDESAFGIRIGGPCRAFTGVARARLYDGQIVIAQMKSP